MHLLFALGFIGLFGMALSFGASTRAGADYVNTSTVTCDSSYPTGGYAILPAQFGFNLRIDDIMANAQSSSYIPVWNQATQSLMIMQDTGSGLVQVPGSTNLSTLVIQLLALGE